MNDETKNNETETTKTEVEESRRRFLKQAGKLAVYTPPAMALMMQPSEARFLRSGGAVRLRDRLGQRDKEEWQSLFERIRNYIQAIFGNDD